MDAQLAGRPRRNWESWAIVLAGGEGRRLLPLVRHVCGEERPKQYAPLLGARSLLRATLDRVATEIPAERTVVVTVAGQRRLAEAELSGEPRPWLLVQPEDRGTAAAVLWAARWIRARSPSAVVAIFPADHYIADESAFMRHVASVSRFVGRADEAPLTLLGVKPTRPETEFGWIEPDNLWAWGREDGRPILLVRSFHEKPPVEIALQGMDRGWLWNTMVVVAGVGALVDTCARLLPRMSRALRDCILAPGEMESSVLRAYMSVAPADFSRDVLQNCRLGLAVSKLPDVGWSDWGTPGRVAETVAARGLHPAWLEALHREVAAAPELPPLPAFPRGRAALDIRIRHR
jgi:mannose-1-phosphate guanylyltransferase